MYVCAVQVQGIWLSMDIVHIYVVHCRYMFMGTSRHTTPSEGSDVYGSRYGRLKIFFFLEPGYLLNCFVFCFFT
jgi:hypothetical protein